RGIGDQRVAAARLGVPCLLSALVPDGIAAHMSDDRSSPIEDGGALLTLFLNFADCSSLRVRHHVLLLAAGGEEEDSKEGDDEEGDAGTHRRKTKKSFYGGM